MKPSANITQVEGSGTAPLALVNEAETTFPGPPAWVRLNTRLIGKSVNEPPVSVPSKVKSIAFTPRETSWSVVRVSTNRSPALGPTVAVHSLVAVALSGTSTIPLSTPYEPCVGESEKGFPETNPDSSPTL